MVKYEMPQMYCVLSINILKVSVCTWCKDSVDPGETIKCEVYINNDMSF